jgi:uncharacterized protein (TIGR02246 family)
VTVAPDAPHDINERFATCFNARDRVGMLELFEPDATIVERDGSLSSGPAGTARHVDALLEVPGTMTSINRSSVVHTDLALLTAGWSIHHEGEPIASATSAEVVRRGADGRWRYLFDQPFAAPAMAGVEPVSPSRR